ncbi:hypothetical protein [Aquimarina sp. I32.4]|uniref:hypothetical protein n=1 Tax=Aquimarina sp. I32.4 TaxID=2053903 RepID=UPI000CDEA664|nr:hypothetical protein [Aquimarina sp. I32.4]
MSVFKEHLIMTKPNEMATILMDMKYVEEANDEIYIESINGIRGYLWVGILLIGAGIFIGYPFEVRMLSDGAIILILLPLIPGLFLTAYGLFGNKRHQKIILDRKNGMITYPDTFFRKPLTGKFKDLKVVFSVTGGDGYSSSEDLKFINTFRPRFIAGNKTIAYGKPDVTWSFYVWYMDKNRPLPLGDIFDPYRDKDFERRKAEGFPPPLYPSAIPTPEATPEQQKERERYWEER